MKCGRCDFDLSPEFAFCPRCGNPLAGAAAVATPVAAPVPAAVPAVDEADRRMATVLFADLAGFTALAETLDPEDVRALQTDLFDALGETLKRYDAFVEKFVGDAVLAVFGAPVAHEDDPERAMLAALEMHAGMASLSARWQGRTGRKLALHIGVNTGRVVAGHLGSAAGAAYAVTGDTVNVTARLQSAAEAGETFVSRATYLLAQHAFAFEARGAVSLKGKSAPMPVYRLVGPADRPHAGRGLAAHGLVAPLIGRDSELHLLVDAFARACEGHAQVVSLLGEAGAGKSRLVDALLERIAAQPRGAATTVRRVVCSSLSQQPYGIFATLFREAYGIAIADSLELARAKVMNGLRALGAEAEEIVAIEPIVGFVLGLSALERTQEIEPERLKKQITMTLRTSLERRLGQGPLVLAIEDMQWADAASIEGLRILADWLFERPLLVLFTGRPPFEPPSQGLGRAQHNVIGLAPLRDADIDAILAALFGDAARACFSAGLHERIVRQAGGNPLYLEEVVRGLIADRVLARGEDGWRCTADGVAVEVPATIEGLLLSRVDRLPPQARRSMQVAAVIGPVFDAALLRAVDREAGDASALAFLCEAEFLAPVDPAADRAATDRYRFSRAILREVVYQNLLLRRRTELHQHTAQALEARCGPNPQRLEDLEALGHHFSLGDDQSRGIRYLVAAGDWARGIYANDDALRHYERALATLKAGGAIDAPEAAGIRERIADLLGPIGRRQEACKHYDWVMETARTAGDAVVEARMRRKLAGLYWEAGERERSLDSLRQGLRLLDGVSDDIELAHLCQEMGRLAFRAGDNQAAIDWAERARGQAEQAAVRAADDDSARREAAAVLSNALNTVGAALARIGRPEEAVGYIERGVEVAGAEGMLQAACRGYANLGVLYATLDPARAVDTCQTGLDTAKKIGDLGFQSRLYANLAVAYCALTNQCDVKGLRAAESAIELDRRLGQIDHLAVPLIVLGQIHQCHGDAGTALRYYEEALGLAEEMAEPQLLFPCYDGIATVYLDRGDPARAEFYLIKADEVCARAGVDRESLVVLPFLC